MGPRAVAVVGDWFGGRLAPLFGPGVLDVEVSGNRRGRWPWQGRWVPGYAHALYFAFWRDERPESVTAVLRRALDLALAGFPEEIR